MAFSCDWLLRLCAGRTMTSRIGQVSDRRQQPAIERLVRLASAQPQGPVGVRERATAQRHEVRLLPRQHPGGLRRVMERPVCQHRHRNMPTRQRGEAGAWRADGGVPGFDLGLVLVGDW
ncbi:hypothetical protein G6F22_020537 [Rhizopus arrhizus]|nr:hypothetical protein G6F22_020537 [Rhizopus arrhizus]